MLVLTASRVVGPYVVHEPGWVVLEGTLIAAVGSGTPPEQYGPAQDLGEVTLAPGFIDMHCHGGGGHWMISADPEAIANAGAFHLSHGTTTMLASTVTVGVDELPSIVSAIAEVASNESSPIIGSHLEGPWISAVRCGAHDAGFIRAPNLEEWEALDHSFIKMVTYAPELPGAARLAASIRSVGAVAAVGHSDASFALGSEAIAAGAAVGTHLFNAMSPLGHREPGLVGACLEGAICELILDLHHVSATAARVAFAVAPGRVALVTDALGPAGLADGVHAVRDAEINVVDGAAWLGGTLAGSTLTMAAAVRNANSIGVPLIDAIAAATAVPAAALGLTDRGALKAGLRADLVALDSDLRVVSVWRSGVRA